MEDVKNTIVFELLWVHDRNVCMSYYLHEEKTKLGVILLNFIGNTYQFLKFQKKMNLLCFWTVLTHLDPSKLDP